MEFQLTKLAGGLLMPLGIVVLLLLAGCLLVVLTRYQRFGYGLVAVGSGLLLLASTPLLPERALGHLEQRFSVLEVAPPNTDWIVILGGGSRGGDGLPAVSRLEPSSLYRLAEGVRLARDAPQARVVTSGGSDREGVTTTAELAAKAAVSWGIEPGRIRAQTTPRTTAAEARDLAQRVEDDDTIVLVTSAFHMQRAVTLFEGQGLNVVPAPTGHLVDPAPDHRHVGEYLPQAKYLRFAERAAWEWLGLLWASLRGQTA